MRRTGRKKRTYSTGNVTYIGDNLARQYNAAPEVMPQARPKKQLSVRTRQNREKLNYMSLGYTLFLTAAIAVVALLCSRYLALQSDITQRSRQITRLESRLNDMKLANDEEYARIMGAVDLESIKKTAMDELGMSYPEHGQIKAYSDVDGDYVRQYRDIP